VIPGSSHNFILKMLQPNSYMSKPMHFVPGSFHSNGRFKGKSSQCQRVPMLLQKEQSELNAAPWNRSEKKMNED